MIAQIVISEILPTEVRSTGTSLILFTGQLCIGLLSKLFSQFISWFGFHGTFFFYSGVILSCLLFGYFLMPEHSGVSLIKIEEQFEKAENEK